MAKLKIVAGSLVVFGLTLAGIVPAKAADWYCESTFSVLGNDKTYPGLGGSQDQALRNSTAMCRGEQAIDAARLGCAGIKFARCGQSDGCRAISTSGPKDHHNNHCVNRGFMGYDSAPEKKPLGRGVCFMRAECATKRPQDPY